MARQLKEGEQRGIYRDFEKGEDYEVSLTYRKATKEEEEKGILGVVTDFKKI